MALVAGGRTYVATTKTLFIAVAVFLQSELRIMASGFLVCVLGWPSRNSSGKNLLDLLLCCAACWIASLCGQDEDPPANTCCASTHVVRSTQQTKPQF